MLDEQIVREPCGSRFITEILNGQCAVTGDTELRLGCFIDTSGEFRLNLRKLYELRLAEQKKGARSPVRRPSTPAEVCVRPADGLPWVGDTYADG